MANPQIENGYVKIANELLEALARTCIPGEARQVLDFILRKTYGYQKKSDQISTAQIAAGTGLYPRAIERARATLRSRKIITTDKNDGTQFLTYRVNKDHESWLPPTKTAGGYRQKPVVSTDKNRGGVPTKTGAATITKDNITKDNKEIKQGQSPAPVENPVENLEVKEAMDRVTSEGLNIYSMLFKAREQMKQPKDFRFPDQVILAVCAAHTREKKQIRNPWIWFVSVLQRETRAWFASQNIAAHEEIKKQDTPEAFKSILQRMSHET